MEGALLAIQTQYAPAASLSSVISLSSAPPGSFSSTSSQPSSPLNNLSLSISHAPFSSSVFKQSRVLRQPSSSSSKSTAAHSRHSAKDQGLLQKEPLSSINGREGKCRDLLRGQSKSLPSSRGIGDSAVPSSSDRGQNSTASEEFAFSDPPARADRGRPLLRSSWVQYRTTVIHRSMETAMLDAAHAREVRTAESDSYNAHLHEPLNALGSALIDQEGEEDSLTYATAGNTFASVSGAGRTLSRGPPAESTHRKAAAQVRAAKDEISSQSKRGKRGGGGRKGKAKKGSGL